MKTIFALILLLVNAVVMAAPQANGPVIKVYAYSSASVPAVKMNRVTKKNAAQPNSLNYQFFLETRRGITIKPTLIWIDGTAYTPAMQLVNVSPVVMKTHAEVGNGYTSDTLVPRTNNKIWKLWPDAALPAQTMQKMKKPAAAVRIEYIYNGKKYSYAVKDIRKLPAVILQ
jgi:hypothetical protein